MRPPAADVAGVRQACPGTRGRASTAALLVAAILFGGGVPAIAVKDPSPRSTGGVAPAPNREISGEAAAVDAQWRQALEAASAARADYEQREHAVEVALAALASSFTASTAADRDADDAGRALETTRAERGRLIRGLYAAGGPTGILAATVAAEDPDAALWRATTDSRLMGIALARTATAEEQARADLRRRQLEQIEAQRSADAAAALLATVRRDAEAADAALARAMAVVDDLAAQRKKLQDAERERLRRLEEALAAERARAAQARQQAVAQVHAIGIPAAYLLDYRAAATTCPGMDWTLLAGVGQVESGHGRNNGPSSAGAIGPMQFMPATFAAYAVDGNADGVTDAWNPTDAIYTAARYLCSTGAGQGPEGVHRALLAYNHAEWYVQLVLAAQAAIRQRADGRPASASH